MYILKGVGLEKIQTTFGFVSKRKRILSPFDIIQHDLNTDGHFNIQLHLLHAENYNNY